MRQHRLLRTPSCRADTKSVWVVKPTNDYWSWTALSITGVHPGFATAMFRGPIQWVGGSRHHTMPTACRPERATAAPE